MVIAAKFAPLCGLADVEKELTSLLVRYNFNLECPYTAEQLFDVILSDKKRRGGNLTLVLPRAIGDCDLVTMPVDEVLVKLKQIL
jgi:3-dehydroquinate synthase